MLFAPSYPPLFRNPPPRCNPLPRQGRRSLHFLLGNILRWFVFPICHTHVLAFLALLSHYFESVTCVFSPKAVYRVLYLFFRPRIFSPSDCIWYHSRTLGAHVLATVVGPLPNGPQFCHIRYIYPGGVTQKDHESAQLSRLEAVAVAPPKSPTLPDITPMASQPQTLAVCLHQWRVPHFALTVSPPQGGDRHLNTIQMPS